MPRKKDAALHAAREQQILEAAKRCFVANGFHRTSMRQILDAAGISSGGAYNYFASKDDIVKALVEAERADIDALLQRLTKHDDPLLGIAGLVHDSIAYYSRDDAVLATEIYAESCRNPAIDEVLRLNTEKMRRLLHETVARGRKNGTIDARHSTADVTEWLLAVIDGYVGRLAANPALKAGKAARMAKASTIDLLEPRGGGKRRP